jgi:hypothetical protein
MKYSGLQNWILYETVDNTNSLLALYITIYGKINLERADKKINFHVERNEDMTCFNDSYFVFKS